MILDTDSLLPMWKDNITFVLVEPREPGNIGASARALKNMGFRKLALFNPPPVITDDARWLAHNALDILESALSYPTLSDAIRESAVVVGTTRRTGRKRGAIFTAHEGARRIADIARGNTVALLFGSSWPSTPRPARSSGDTASAPPC